TSTFNVNTFTTTRKDTQGRPSWIEVSAPNSTFAKVLREIFQIPSNKRLATIPSILFESPKDIAMHFLATYIAGDGCGVKDSVLIRSVSQSLVDSICHLLIKCEIPFHIRRCKQQKPSHGTPLEISITKNYVEMMSGFSVIGRKREDQVKAIAWNSEGPFYSRWVPVNHLNLRGLIQENSSKIPWALKNILYNDERTSITTAKKLLSYVQYTQAKDIEKILDSDLRFDKVVEVKEVRPEKPYVYDLYVPESSSFLSGFGGIITHNCWWRKDGGCTFCSWPTLYPIFRVRKPELLVEEIGQLIERYGAKSVFDDTGCFPAGNWLRKFSNLLIERGYGGKARFGCNMRFGALTREDYTLMRRAGFRMLLFGVESGRQDTLNRLNKGTSIEGLVKECKIAREEGLEPHITIMTGFPWEKREDAMSTLSLAKMLMEKGWALTLQSTIVIPYPGSKLYAEALERDWFRVDPKDYDRFDMKEPVLTTPDMSPEEVMKICDQIYKVFLSPKYMLKQLVRIRSFDDLKYSLKGAAKVLGHVEDFTKNK
ncbi:MAG: radical SAM protein, partial [Candidatus Bathyarchaeota archaeon]